MKMYAARHGIIVGTTRTPCSEDLVAFYSKAPVASVTKRSQGGEEVVYWNPGDDVAVRQGQELEVVGDIMTHTRWRDFGPELTPGTVRAFEFFIAERPVGHG